MVRRTHVLVTSHDYPPIPSPQAMRVGKLVEGLVANGCSVDVITSMPAEAMKVTTDSGALRVVRAVPQSAHQYIRRILEALRRRKAGIGATHLENARSSSLVGAGLPAKVRLNWKGRIAGIIDNILWGARFPGASRAWLPAATPLFREHLEKRRPDCVVLCHEPPAALELLAHLAGTGIPVVVELGDPVFAPYTPRKWRKQALQLESLVCAIADRIVVTCEVTRQLLLARHDPAPGKIVVLTQGFDVVAEKRGSANPDAPLRLVYTGRFYSFRRPDALIEAVAGMHGVELVIVAASESDWLPRSLPSNVRVTGELPQQDAIRAQEAADILVNIANEGLPQVPGKFYEYLGQPVPILHLFSDDGDERTALLHRLGRGWSIANEASAIGVFLRDAVEKHRAGTLRIGLDMDNKSVDAYSWTSIGRGFSDTIRAAAGTLQAATGEASEKS